MNQRHQFGNGQLSRREVIAQMGSGFGGVALGSLLGDFDRTTSAAESGGHNSVAKRAHHQPQARAVIQLFMHGGPSQVDLLDEKKELARMSGQAAPAEVADDEKRTTYLLGSPFKFSKHGESGLEFSEVLPGIAKHADDIDRKSVV